MGEFELPPWGRLFRRNYRIPHSNRSGEQAAGCRDPPDLPPRGLIEGHYLDRPSNIRHNRCRQIRISPPEGLLEAG